MRMEQKPSSFSAVTVFGVCSLFLLLRGAGREKLKQDGVNIADWLTALALFTGHAAKVRLSLLQGFTISKHDRGSINTLICNATLQMPRDVHLSPITGLAPSS